jgi:chromate transporter
VATIAIFLPGFLLVALAGRLIHHVRRSALAASLFDGVVAGSLALMAQVTWQLGRVALQDPLTVAIFAISAALLIRFRVNSALLIAAGAFVGWAARTFA